MTSTFFGLTIALRGLLAGQRGVDVTNHNIANARTRGYSRQDMLLSASAPYTVPSLIGSPEAGQLGTGVDVQRIRRLRDHFLDLQVRQELSALGRWEVRQEGFARLEATLSEPSGSGLGQLFARFWAAWQELSTNPSSSAARANIVQQSANLASVFNRTAQQLRDLQQRQDELVASKADEINSLAERIAALNAQIGKVIAGGQSPNDLQDARDRLLDELARVIKIGYQEMPDGMVQVSIGSITLVAGGAANRIVVQRNSSTQLLDLQWPDGSAVGVNGGELQGILELRDTVVPQKLRELDALAIALRDAVNNVHAGGYGLDNSTGLAFFVGTEARDLAVNPVLTSDLNRIAAASSPDSPGDGSQALAVARLQRQALLNGGTMTVDDYYAAMIARLGGESQQAADMAENQGLLVDHLDLSREAVAGVSLDEEMANLIRYQHAYEAAARVMRAIDEMLEVLVREVGPS